MVRRDEVNPSTPAMKIATGSPCQQAASSTTASESVKVIFCWVIFRPAGRGNVFGNRPMITTTGTSASAIN